MSTKKLLSILLIGLSAWGGWELGGPLGALFLGLCAFLGILIGIWWSKR